MTTEEWQKEEGAVSNRDDVDAGEVWPEQDAEELEQLAIGDFEPLEEPPPVATRWPTSKRRHDQERGMDPGLFC